MGISTRTAGRSVPTVHLPITRRRSIKVGSARLHTPVAWSVQPSSSHRIHVQPNIDSEPALRPSSNAMWHVVIDVETP